VFGEKSVPVILPRYRVQDIDTQEDWVRAEWMFRAMRADGQP
jgi:N-acylneuraminate cytidylyltransferase